MSGAAEPRRTEPLKISGATGRRAPVSSAVTARPVPASNTAATDIAAVFIELEIAVRRAATLDELRFTMINAWQRLVPVDQAVLCEPARTTAFRATLAANVSAIDRYAPVVTMVDQWVRDRSGTEHRPADVHVGRLTGADARDGETPVLHALWVPLKSREGDVLAAVVLLRDRLWQPHEQALLLPLADAFAHAWAAMLPQRTTFSRRAYPPARRWLTWACAAAVVCAGLLPVQMSSLAPAEIVAANPSVITSPIDGVLADILVPPGGEVARGQLIARFVDVKTRNDVEIAARTLAVTASRYFRVVQSSTANTRDGARDAQDLATAKAEWDLAKAELAYVSEIQSRTEIRAERSGILVYASKADWVGKPLTTGERIMEIGDPRQVEVRVDLPVSDAIVLAAGNRFALFLDGDPLTTIPGRIDRTSYRPVLSPDQQLIYRIFGRMDHATPLRIGLRGTARVSSDDVPLAYYLFRRPIAAVRQRLGV
jgi:multidrug efflux pump subunit AcrA (membrane-fusion protein)